MKKAKYLVFVLMLILVGCGKEEETKVIEKPAKYVVTEGVKTRTMNQIFRSDAVLEPKDKINHQTEKGGTIVKILKKNGDKVKIYGDGIMLESFPGQYPGVTKIQRTGRASLEETQEYEDKVNELMKPVAVQ